MYDARECQCVCNDSDEECKEQEKKVWDSDTCSCQCFEVKECTTGTKFDYNTCRWDI